MAAITGATATVPRAGRRKVGAVVRTLPEASSLTFPKGVLLAELNGSISTASTAYLQSTGLIGIAVNSGQNLTSNGIARCAYFAFEQGQAIKLTLNTTWTGSSLRGATAGLYQSSNGNVMVGTAAGASSCGTIIDAVEWDNGIQVADGDVYPVVYFIPADTAILYS